MSSLVKQFMVLLILSVSSLYRVFIGHFFAYVDLYIRIQYNWLYYLGLGNFT